MAMTMPVAGYEVVSDSNCGSKNYDDNGGQQWQQQQTTVIVMAVAGDVNDDGDGNYIRRWQGDVVNDQLVMAYEGNNEDLTMEVMMKTSTKQNEKQQTSHQWLCQLWFMNKH